MRKLLLGTTAVVGASLIAGAAMAQMPVVVEPPGFMAGAGGNGTARGSMSAIRVSLGGYFDARMGLVNDTNDRNAVTVGAGTTGARSFGRQRTDFQSDMEFNIFVDGKAANGLEYGAVLEMQMDNVGAGATGTTLDTDEFYGFLSHPVFGSVRFGDEDSAGSLMQVRAPLVRGADTDNYWDEFLFRAGAASDGSPSLLTGLGDGSDNSKIIYLSPQYFGFDFGLSYAANGGEGERFALGRTQQASLNTATSVGQRDRSGRRNEITGAIRYRGTFGPVGLTAGFVAYQADSQQPFQAIGAAPLARRQTAYSGGIQLAAYGFTIGGEYTWGKWQGVSVGLAPVAQGRENSRNIVVGAVYTVPGLGTQFGGFWGQATQDNGRATIGGVANRNVADRNQTVFGFGAVHPLAPGLQLYASYTHMRDANEPTSATSNVLLDQDNSRAGTQTIRRAEVYMAGMRVAF